MAKLAAPNPQGKGNLPVLSILQEGRSAVRWALPKTVDQVSTELFTSLFILGSDFSFRPVPLTVYWLYQKNDRFRLSLVGPTEWWGDQFGALVGRCELQKDLTWTLELSDRAMRDPELQILLREKREDFGEKLEKENCLQNALPRYDQRIPFYQRAFAYGLAKSLQASMQASGIAELSYPEAKGLLASKS